MVNTVKTSNITWLRENWVILFTVQRSGLLYVEQGKTWLLDFQLYRILEIISFQYNIQTLNYFCALCPNNIHITIILPAVLYGCEIWSLWLREKRRLGGV